MLEVSRAGLLPAGRGPLWVWLATGVTSATRSFVVNAPLIKEMGIAHAILPLSNVMQELAHFVLALPAVIAWVVLAGGYQASLSWLWQIPLMLALQAAFVYPIALGCALANAYVRDIDYLLGIGFPLAFFATPMVYPISIVPEPLLQYFELNPLHALMQSWRSVLIEGALDRVATGAAELARERGVDFSRSSWRPSEDEARILGDPSGPRMRPPRERLKVLPEH